MSEATIACASELSVVVDYYRSLQDAITAAHCNFVQPFIKPKYFPRSKDRGKKQVAFKTFCFDQPFELAEAVKLMQMAMRKAGCRSATIFELLAVAEAHSEPLNPLFIPRTVSVYKRTDISPMIPTFWTTAQYLRILGFDPCVGKFTPDFHFLGVCK